MQGTTSTDLGCTMLLCVGSPARQAKVREVDLDVEELTGAMRAARIARLLSKGRRLRNQEIARIVHLSPRGARKMMAVLSLCLPIFRDKNGYWRECDGTRG